MPAQTGTNKWLAISGLALGVLMSTLDSSIVNISLPTLVEAFDTNFATVQWVVLSYVLVLTSLMLVVARLGDMREKKSIYMAGMALFTVSSLLCGLSPSIGWLIAFRALQGLGATMMQALGVAMVTEIFPPAERGRALGVMGGVVSVGIALGPPIGGLLIGLAGWHWVFLVNVPIGLLTLLIVRRYVPNSPPVNARQRFDRLGAVTLFVTLAAYALGMTTGQRLGFSSTLPLGLLIASAVGLVTLILIERRAAQPMIDLSLFRNILFSMNLLMGMLVFLVLAGGFIFPFYLELVKGYSTETTGLLLMANPVAMGLVAPLAGALSDRFGSRGISLIGLLLLIAACFGFSTLTTETSQLGIMLRLVPLGLGFGIFQSPNNSAIMGSVRRERLGIASGLLSLSRTLGNTTGLPLMGALFTAQVMAAAMLPTGTDITAVPDLALLSGLTGTYRLAAYILLGATVLAVAAIVIDQRRKQAARRQEVYDSAQG